MILIKKQLILQTLVYYKIQTYAGKVTHVHFKDIYQKLVKKVFKEEIGEDFEISKYLKNKMKNQWIDNYKRLKTMDKTGFKAHQAYASQIICNYAKRFRYSREQADKMASIENELLKNTNKKAEFVDNDPDGKQIMNDTANLKKLKQKINPQYNIGFAETSDGVPMNKRKYQNQNRDSGNKLLTGINLDDESPKADIMREGYNIGMGGRTRQKNKDENPQEFEEVGSEDEQSHPGITPDGPQGHGQYRLQQRVPYQNQPRVIDDSMLASDENNMQFNIKMNKSITDSAMDKSDSNMRLISPKNTDQANDTPGQIIPSRSGQIEGNTHMIGGVVNEIGSEDATHGRSKSHQMEPISRDRVLRERGSGEQIVQRAPIPEGHQVGQPPRTANQGQNPRNRQGRQEMNNDYNNGIEQKNNFFKD